jgi:acetyl-CoA acetyltransferase
VTAGNASGVNDGACALLLADEATPAQDGLTPRARVVGMATAGVAPRIMGIGPAPATQKVLALTGLTLEQMDVIELNEAFAAQGLAVLRLLGLPTTTSASTPGAAPSRWATRWAPAARGWPPRRSTACTPPAGATRCAPCASASGQGIALVLELGRVNTNGRTVYQGRYLLAWKSRPSSSHVLNIAFPPNAATSA